MPRVWPYADVPLQLHGSLFELVITLVDGAVSEGRANSRQCGRLRRVCALQRNEVQTY